jgi:hypothetical protein
MSRADRQGTRTEAVAIFEYAETFQAAIDEILSSGFDRAELNLLASEHAVKEKLGYMYEEATELEDDPSVPRAAYVSTEAIGDAEGALIGGLFYVGAVAAAGAVVASGGTLAGAIVAGAMTGGAGGLIGSVLAKLVGQHHADHMREQLLHGGLLLWVRTRDKDHEARATEILSKHSGHDVHIHALPEARA